LTYEEQEIGSVNLQPDTKPDVLNDVQINESASNEPEGECEACNI